MAAASNPTDIPLSSKEFKKRFKKLSNELDLGGGSYGKVYGCKWDGKDAAVKEVEFFENDKRRSAEHITECCKTWAKLRHYNIIKFYGLYIEKDKAYIIMERAHGGTLSSNLKKAISIGTFLKWSKGITNALYYLHKEGLVHRDLKSNNILVDSKGEAKIIDFDFLRRDTPSMSSGGAWSIRAPEMLDPNRKIERTAKTDIWSFALLLLEMVTLNNPIKEAEGDQQLFAFRVYEYNWRPTIPESCPLPIMIVIEMCWKKDPEQRPSAEKLYEYLDYFEKSLEKQGIDLEKQLDKLTLEEAVKHLICTVCGEFFQDAEMLKCGSFRCKTCTMKTFRIHSKACEICKLYRNVMLKTVVDLPCIEMINSVSMQAKSIEMACPICSNESNFVYCEHCNTFMCRNCKELYDEKTHENLKYAAQDIDKLIQVSEGVITRYQESKIMLQLEKVKSEIDSLVKSNGTELDPNLKTGLEKQSNIIKYSLQQCENSLQKYTNIKESIKETLESWGHKYNPKGKELIAEVNKILEWAPSGAEPTTGIKNEIFFETGNNAYIKVPYIEPIIRLYNSMKISDVDEISLKLIPFDLQYHDSKFFVFYAENGTVDVIENKKVTHSYQISEGCGMCLSHDGEVIVADINRIMNLSKGGPAKPYENGLANDDFYFRPVICQKNNKYFIRNVTHINYFIRNVTHRNHKTCITVLDSDFKNVSHIYMDGVFYDIAVSDNDEIFFFNKGKIIKYSMTGKCLAEKDLDLQIWGITNDRYGNVLVTKYGYPGCVKVFTSDLQEIASFGGDVLRVHPARICVLPDDRVAVCYISEQKILIFSH